MEDKTARTLLKKYAYMIDSWWIEEEEYDEHGKMHNVYFVELKRPYAYQDGPDYWAAHFTGWGSELENYFKIVEKIDPELWDNGGE